MTRQKRIIDSFSRNEQSLKTRRLFARWLSSPVDADAKNEALAGLWEHTESYSDHTETALKKTRERIFGERRPHMRIPAVLRWAVAAAIIAPLVTVGLSMLYVGEVRRSCSEWTQTAVPCGQRQQLTLADGTRLWLGAGTRVIYPVSFGGNGERKIFVDGEIFAQVAHDASRPFVISAGDADVRVLGTTFGMRAYDSDSEIELMLVEGSVRFDIESSKCDDKILMSPGDMVRYNRMSGSVERSTFNKDNYHSWALDGSIYFFNEPLGNIATQLSRRFDRRIVITDPQLLPIRFHVFLSGTDNLSDVLKIFMMNKSIAIRERDDIIYIMKR